MSWLDGFSDKLGAFYDETILDACEYEGYDLPLVRGLMRSSLERMRVEVKCASSDAVRSFPFLSPNWVARKVYSYDYNLPVDSVCFTHAWFGSSSRIPKDKFLDLMRFLSDNMVQPPLGFMVFPTENDAEFAGRQMLGMLIKRHLIPVKEEDSELWVLRYIVEDGSSVYGRLRIYNDNGGWSRGIHFDVGNRFIRLTRDEFDRIRTVAKCYLSELAFDSKEGANKEVMNDA